PGQRTEHGARAWGFAVLVLRAPSPAGLRLETRPETTPRQGRARARQRPRTAPDPPTVPGAHRAAAGRRRGLGPAAGGGVGAARRLGPGAARAPARLAAARLPRPPRGRGRPARPTGRGRRHHRRRRTGRPPGTRLLAPVGCGSRKGGAD